MSLIPFDTRVRAYDTIYNFRDFGGYQGLDGAKVRTGRLLQSGLTLAR